MAGEGGSGDDLVSLEPLFHSTEAPRLNVAWEEMWAFCHVCLETGVLAVSTLGARVNLNRNELMLTGGSWLLFDKKRSFSFASRTGEQIVKNPLFPANQNQSLRKILICMTLTSTKRGYIKVLKIQTPQSVNRTPNVKPHLSSRVHPQKRRLLPIIASCFESLLLEPRARLIRKNVCLPTRTKVHKKSNQDGLHKQ